MHDTNPNMMQEDRDARLSGLLHIHVEECKTTWRGPGFARGLEAKRDHASEMLWSK